MGNKEIFNYLKNAKIQDKTLEQICYYFAKDYTASKTAQELKISRQTINNYYKIIRTLLLKNQKIISSCVKSNSLCEKSFSIKYLKSSSRIVYFIECNDKVYFINEDSDFLPNIHKFIEEQLEDSLLKNRKANCARILFNEERKNFLITKVFNTQNLVQEFVENRLKKFRGLNNENFLLHLNESQIRFNHSKEHLYNTLLSLLNLNTKTSTFCRV